MKKHILLLSTSIILSGCITDAQIFPQLELPKFWGNETQTQSAPIVETASLEKWWEKFEDPALNNLIDLSMVGSPDRIIAEARIREARGVKRNARSFLFPQIGASATGGRQDNADTIDNYYESTFDASYEVDVFGKNRKNVNAADAQIEALEAQYQDVTLTLIAEISRSYINYRAFQKQSAIAKKNLSIQEKTLELIKQQREFGEAPQLDVERSENIVNTTKSSIPEFERLEDNARLQLSVLTGMLPQDLISVLNKPADIPAISAEPILLAPSNVLSIRPDIRAASANLSANTALAESVTAELFPTFTISGFFGAADNLVSNSTSIWNIALGAAVNLIDFGRIEGRIDSARAREMQAYQTYRRTILEAVTEVETALTDTSHIRRQRISLQKAYESADRSLTLSETLYKEGEISFLDVLDSQRTVNEAESALITAEAAQAESIVRLYKSLGVY